MLLKLWTFLLGWGGGVLEHPQHPPRYGPVSLEKLTYIIRLGLGLGLGLGLVTCIRYRFMVSLQSCW